MARSLWTPASTARLDQAAEHIRRRALAHGMELSGLEVDYLLGLLLSWAKRHEDHLNQSGLWVPELHWLASAVATAAGSDTVVGTIRASLLDWEREHPWLLGAD